MAMPVPLHRIFLCALLLKEEPHLCGRVGQHPQAFLPAKDWYQP